MYQQPPDEQPQAYDGASSRLPISSSLVARTPQGQRALATDA